MLLAATPMTAQGPLRLFSCFGADPARPADMAERYDLVIWHNDPVLRQALLDLRQRNAAITGLMYRELFCVSQVEGPLGETVGSYAWIDAHHPEWFQRDQQGRRIRVTDYPGRWMMDVGHPDWQTFWIEQTLQDVVAGGWDGVFADDALTTIRAHRLPPLAGYPTDQALQAAMSGFLERATSAFHQAGKRVIANASNASDYPGLWERWLDVTDGLMEEHFAGDGWTWGEAVAQRQLSAMQAAVRRNKWMLCLTYGPWSDPERMETSLAAYLIGAGSTTYWSYRPDAAPDEPAWHPSWAVPLGQPIGEAVEGSAIWQRPFERGLVIVNASRSPQRVATSCGAISLKPKQGRVLTTACVDPFRSR